MAANTTELKARLAFWRNALEKLREAYLALLDGGVKSYKIGNGELTRLDLFPFRSASMRPKKRWTNWRPCWQAATPGGPLR